MATASRTIIDRMRAPFSGLFGVRYPRFNQLGIANDVPIRAMNAAYSDTVDLIGLDARNNRLIGGSFVRAIALPIRCQISANGKIGQKTPFFVNNNDATPLEITEIMLDYGTADGVANTAVVTKDQQGQIPGAGASTMTGTFNLNTTTNTIQTAVLAGTSRGYPSIVLGSGEQLTLSIASAVTSLASLYVTVWVKPYTGGSSVGQYSRPANGDIATGVLMLNLIPGLKVRAISMRWSVAATDAGAVTIDITKDTGTAAPGAGTSVLLAAQSVKGTINTTVFVPLAVSAATLTMASGDRLALKTTGVLTALAGLVVSILYESLTADFIQVSVPFWDAQATDRILFVSNASYQVVDYWEVWSTASTSNKQVLTKDTGTTAPGAGTALLTDNTNAGIDTSATANTPVEGTLTAVKPNLWVANGDRLSVKNSGTTGALAGAVGTVLLRKV